MRQKGEAAEPAQGYGGGDGGGADSRAGTWTKMLRTWYNSRQKTLYGNFFCEKRDILGTLENQENEKDKPRIRVRKRTYCADQFRREGMERIRRVCAVLIACALLLSGASASGLFPSVDNLFGIAMPSVSKAVGREPDEKNTAGEEKQETYLNFNSDDYDMFGQYLAGTGASIKEYSVENGVMNATVSVRDASIVFAYDWTEQKAVVTYPSGTRPETEAEECIRKVSILPPVGGVMPSAEFAIDRKPDGQSTAEAGLTLTWENFSDDEYAAFSNYLAETGAKAESINVEAGILNAKISLNECTFTVVYNWNAQSLNIVYPEGTIPESRKWNLLVGKEPILPETESYGRELPRISVALEREPSSTETLADGSMQERYLDFNEAEYNEFSLYLQQSGCQLEDYHMDENGVLVINLNNGSGRMAFLYNAALHTGTAVYPVNTRIEEPFVPKYSDQEKDKFTLHNGVIFGMTMDEVNEIETGKGYIVNSTHMNYPYFDENGEYLGKTADCLSISGSMAGINDSKLYYYFDDDGKLFASVYKFGEHDPKSYEEIEELLDQKYSGMTAKKNYTIARITDALLQDELTNGKIDDLDLRQIILQDGSRVQIIHSLLYSDVPGYGVDLNLFFGGHHYLEYRLSSLEEIESVNGIIDRKEQLEEEQRQKELEEHEQQRRHDI